MPKMKTKSAAKKRFRKNGSGKIRYKRAFGRHILTTKNSRRKRGISKKVLVNPSDFIEVSRMLRGG